MRYQVIFINNNSIEYIRTIIILIYIANMDEQYQLLEQTFLRGLIKKVIKFVKVNLIIMSYYYKKAVLFVSHCVILYPHLINMSPNFIDRFC